MFFAHFIKLTLSLFMQVAHSNDSSWVPLSSYISCFSNTAMYGSHNGSFSVWIQPFKKVPMKLGMAKSAKSPLYKVFSVYGTTKSEPSGLPYHVIDGKVFEDCCSSNILLKCLQCQNLMALCIKGYSRNIWSHSTKCFVNMGLFLNLFSIVPWNLFQILLCKTWIME